MTMTSPYPQAHAYSQERKMKKPLMEKRRRARINHCLMELKSLLLQAAPHQRSKLEKADILEMTVQYLRTLNETKPQTDPTTVRQSYVDGYSNCAGAVLHYLNGHPEHSPNSQLRLGLFSHLNGFLCDRVKNLPSAQLSVSIPVAQQPTPPYGMRRDSATDSPFSQGSSELSPISSVGSPSSATEKAVWRPW